MAAEPGRETELICWTCGPVTADGVEIASDADDPDGPWGTHAGCGALVTSQLVE